MLHTRRLCFLVHLSSYVPSRFLSTFRCLRIALWGITACTTVAFVLPCSHHCFLQASDEMSSSLNSLHTTSSRILFVCVTEMTQVSSESPALLRRHWSETLQDSPMKCTSFHCLNDVPHSGKISSSCHCVIYWWLLAPSQLLPASGIWEHSSPCLIPLQGTVKVSGTAGGFLFPVIHTHTPLVFPS